MQASDPKKIVEAMLDDEEGMPDPKKMALQLPNDSQLFQDFMRNYERECRKLYEAAKQSGALTGDEPEGMVIRMVMQIAAKQFEVESMISGPYRKTYRNLMKFL